MRKMDENPSSFFVFFLKIEKKKGGLAIAKLLIMGAGDGRLELGGMALGSG
ncbi:hypothetical protein [Fictibacillus phosphorivorans]|uniref:hypothetical protein n=1 Tax=Fictibacillus phosphorivorans TaxID=1221500 RepID=UPI0036D2E11C